MYSLLQGVTVLEFGSVVMGPYAGQILADLGANVIKVEQPGGDIARASHPAVGGEGTLFVNNNRNKRAIALDLKTAEGREVAHKLIAGADVLLHNMRVAAAERAGIGFAAAGDTNPELVYCAAIGFGQGGRYRDRPAFDDVVQAASGLASLSAQTGGDPAFMPTIIADKLGALHAVQGILAALCAKARGHAGPIAVEVPMFEVAVALLMNEHLAGATATGGATGYPRLFSPDRRPHRTQDGWLAVLPYTEAQWEAFLREIGRDDVIANVWFRSASVRQSRLPELYAIVSQAMPERTTQAWIERLTALDIPCSPIASLDDLLADPHLEDVGFFAPGPLYPPEIARSVGHPVRFSTGQSDDRPPPALGRDTVEILREHGFAEDRITRLVDGGAVVAA